MKSKHEIPNKFDYMKVHSVNFIANEKVNSDLVHEQNVGKISSQFYNLASGNEEKATKESINKQNLISKETSIRKEDLDFDPDSIQIETTSRADYSGSSAIRYTTTCYMKVVPRPIWYTESVFLKIGSTKRKYEEKIYFKNEPRPYRWSETMITEANTVPKSFKYVSHVI